MSEVDLLLKLWPVLGFFFFGTIWFVRLETKFGSLEKDYNEHKESIKNKDLTMWAKIDSIQASVNTVIQSMVRVETKIDMQQHKEDK